MSKPNEDFMSAIRLNKKFDEFTLKLVTITSKLETLSTKQINQLSSTFDQMAKILDDILEETNGNC